MRMEMETEVEVGIKWRKHQLQHMLNILADHMLINNNKVTVRNKTNTPSSIFTTYFTGSA